MHNHAHRRGHYPGCKRGRACWCEARRYVYVILISVAIFSVELTGWWFSNSLALLGESGHVLVDIAALSVALVISIRARKQPLFEARRTRTIGFAVQIALLAVTAVGVFIAGMVRCFDPPTVWSLPLILAAIPGALGNLWQVSILEGGFKNINAMGPRAHIWGDLLTSIGVIVSGIVIMTTGWHTIDPLISIGIAFYLAYQVYRMFALAHREARRKHEHPHE